MSSQGINTTQVTNRRTLQLHSLDDLRQEVIKLSETRCDMLGNWELGQIFEHLAKGLNASIDGLDFRPPWGMRVIGPFLKKSMLTRPMKPGFQLPEQAAQHFRPGMSTSVREGRDQLLAAIERCEQTEERAHHVIFGKMTATEANQFHLRHAELHLSFVIPRYTVD